MDAAELDEWRLLEAERLAKAKHVPYSPLSWATLAEYRRLVREGIEPPDPDQDVLDTREVLARYWQGDSRGGVFLDALAEGRSDNDADFLAAKQALKEIKDRVRREAEAAVLNDVVTSLCESPEQCDELYGDGS